MLGEDDTRQLRIAGRIACWTVFFLTVVYVTALALGFLSLRSPNDPIGDPYFTILELLICLMTLAMLVAMVAIHGYAAPRFKVYGLAAVAFMVLLTAVTSGVHFVILTVRGCPGLADLLSFKWPSVAYALDILAWDVFFALSMLFAALIFRMGRLERAVRLFMIAAGLFSFAGLAGVPVGNMNIRNIGIIGYAILGPVAFFLAGIVIGRGKTPGT